MDKQVTRMLPPFSRRASDRRWRFVLAGITCLVCAAGLAEPAWSADPPPGRAAAASQVVLTDPWNMPIAMNMIPGGAPALFFVCDPSDKRCREGAVYFDSRRGRIEEEKIRPVFVLVASPEAAREAAAKMSLNAPVYVDSGRTLASKLIGQDIMPALVLLDGKGNLVKVIPGGGEALDDNITAMLKARPDGHGMIWAILVTMVLAGAALLVAY